MVFGPIISELVNILFDHRARSRRRKEKLENLSRHMERLERIHNTMLLNYRDLINRVQSSLRQNECQQLIKCRDEAEDWRRTIRSDLQYMMQGNISKYATRVRTLALKTLKLSQKYGIDPNIRSVQYDSPSKMLRINDKNTYFMG